VTRLAAQSLTPAVWAWLHTACHVRVLHVFERVCNLVADDSSVLSLVTPAVGNGPFNMVVPPIDFIACITPTDPVDVQPDELCIGRLMVTTASAQTWNPFPDWRRLRQHRDRLLAHEPLIRRVLQEHAPANSFAHLVVELSPPPSAIEARCLDVAHEHWRVMVRGLRHLDRDACRSSATHLVGLGSGLTPAGDDWLLGCALAAHLGLPTTLAAGLLLSAIRSAAAGTNILSAHWLRAAVQGACGAPWHAFFEACVRSDRQQINHAARHILRQGHSSGADALAGYVALCRTGITQDTSYEKRFCPENEIHPSRPGT
jgi:hypothetical protein